MVYQAEQNRVDLEDEDAQYGEFILNFDSEWGGHAEFAHIYNVVGVEYGEKMDGYLCYFIFMHSSNADKECDLFHNVHYLMKLWRSWSKAKTKISVTQTKNNFPRCLSQPLKLS